LSPWHTIYNETDWSVREQGQAAGRLCATEQARTIIMSVPSHCHRPPGQGRTGAGGLAALALRRVRFWLGGEVMVAAVLAVGCGQQSPARAKKPAEVFVNVPITEEVLDYQDFTGRLDAIRTVDIRARVNGYLVKAFGEGEAPLKEGDRVKA